MKQLILGMLLGGSLMGIFMSSKQVELEQQIEIQQVENNRLGNQVAELKLTNNDLRIENAQLHWELEQAK